MPGAALGERLDEREGRIPVVDDRRVEWNSVHRASETRGTEMSGRTPEGENLEVPAMYLEPRWNFPVA